jgi:hypothetical protein
VLPVPRSLDGVFHSVVGHINSRKEKARPKQLDGLPFRAPRFAG